jgi:hypothetical protein
VLFLAFQSAGCAKVSSHFSLPFSKEKGTYTNRSVIAKDRITIVFLKLSFHLKE